METSEKKAAYEKAFEELQAVLEGETDLIAKMATIPCILKENLPYYFWVGFYLMKNDALIVGPYQGTLGCLHIKMGKGVCGTSAQERRTLVVPDVHQFPGHIACDARSCSEIVVPVIDGNDRLLGVFDVDSSDYNSFDETDQHYLEAIMTRFFKDAVND